MCQFLLWKENMPKKVLTTYSEPKIRIHSEINPPLKAIATVISSMKKASKQTVSKKTWNQIIGLYPYLVQFTETNSPQIGKAVKDALLEYHDLLQPLLCPWFMNKFLIFCAEGVLCVYSFQSFSNICSNVIFYAFILFCKNKSI